MLSNWCNTAFGCQLLNCMFDSVYQHVIVAIGTSAIKAVAASSHACERSYGSLWTSSETGAGLTAFAVH